MAPSTKEAALAKLDKMDVMVGYPDKWRDYSGLTLDPADLYGNVERSAAFEYAYALQDLGKPVDRRKWAMNAQERSEEHTSELQSLMRISYAVFCLKKKTKDLTTPQ